ncbi:uncharacterized protein [Branchiostoma lanceolatum]|uniref:uncharacterized protein n=1 Tax=Branchiostoma lanceolatum TaxID=7740 RepID=UPI0034555E86
MEESPVALPIKQEPVDSCSFDGSTFPDVANQEVAGSNKHDFNEPPQEEAGDEYPTHWQAADGLVSIGHAARIKQQIRGRLYVCSECDYQASRADVIKHQRLHTRARPYVCLLCNFAGTQNSHLRSHFKRHHSAPLDEDNHMVIPQSHFICQECQIIFPTQEKLQSHLSNSHTNDEQNPSNNEEGDNRENTQVDSLQKNHVGQPNGALESVIHVNNTVHRDNEQRSPPRSDSCTTSKNKIISSSNILPPTEQRVSTRSAQMLQDDSDCSSKGTRFNSDIAYLQSVFTNNQESQSTLSSKESVENTQSSFTQSNVFEHRTSRTEESPTSIEDSLTQQYAAVASSNSSEYKSLAYANDDHVPPSSTCSEGLATVGSGSSSRAKKTFTCSECGYRGGKKDVQKHLTVHTGFRPYVCLQCGHTTAQNNHMRKHFQRIHPGQEAEFDVRTDEFYICSSCLYFFLTQKRFNKHFDMGTCARGWPDTSSRSDAVSQNHAIPQNQTLFHPQTTAVNTKDYEDERDIRIPETSYNFSNSLEEGHHPTQRNRQRKNTEPKCAKTNGTTNIPQNAHPDVINLFRRSINIGNNYEELRTEEAMSWSTELPSHEPTRTSVSDVNHASLPSLVETRSRSNKTHSNQEKSSSNSRNSTSRLLQNSTTSASYRKTRSRSHQNGGEPFSQEDPKTTHSSVDDTGAMNSQTVGNAAAVPLHSVSLECSTVDAEQNCDKDVHSTNAECQSSVPRNIRKAARRSLQKYTQAQKRQRKTYHDAPDNNRGKPIKPFIWHFQGRSYITYEIAGKTSRSLPKDDRQMACNFCPYKTSKKELLRLHMRRHLWMS